MLAQQLWKLPAITATLRSASCWPREAHPFIPTAGSTAGSTAGPTAGSTVDLKQIMAQMNDNVADSGGKVQFTRRDLDSGRMIPCQDSEKEMEAAEIGLKLKATAESLQDLTYEEKHTWVSARKKVGNEQYSAAKFQEATETYVLRAHTQLPRRRMRGVTHPASSQHLLLLPLLFLLRLPPLPPLPPSPPVPPPAVGRAGADMSLLSYSGIRELLQWSTCILRED